MGIHNLIISCQKKDMTFNGTPTAVQFGVGSCVGDTEIRRAT